MVHLEEHARGSARRASGSPLESSPVHTRNDAARRILRPACDRNSAMWESPTDEATATGTRVRRWLLLVNGCWRRWTRTTEGPRWRLLHTRRFPEGATCSEFGSRDRAGGGTKSARPNASRSCRSTLGIPRSSGPRSCSEGRRTRELFALGRQGSRMVRSASWCRSPRDPRRRRSSTSSRLPFGQG